MSDKKKASINIDSLVFPSSTFLEWTLFVFLSLFYICIAFSLGLGTYDGGPDELMRSLIPRCIINGNLLPSGYDNCAIFHLGNWSYAFYPQMIAGYLSAFFMFVAMKLGAGASYIYMSGRLASVVFGLITVFAVSRIVGIIFSNRKNQFILRCFSIIFLGFWPQFAFLSSYMNNDIAAICGVSILLYALTSGIRDGWKTRNSVVLSLGVSLAGLGYWNSYGFILIAIVLFIVTVCLQYHTDKYRIFNLIGIASGISAILVLPWFLLNLVRYHELTGMSAFHERYVEWLQNGGRVLQNAYTQGIGSLLFDTNYIQDTLQSFIGRLGYMAIPMPFIFVLGYYLLIGVGIGMMLGHIRERWASYHFRMITVGVVIASLITIFLSMYYSTRIDYQPQGRYIIYILLPIVLMIIIGIGDSFELNSISEISVFLVVILLYVGVCIGFFYISSIRYDWSGVAWQGAL